MLVRLTEIESQSSARDSSNGIKKASKANNRIFGLLTVCLAMAGWFGTTQGAIAQEAQQQVKAQAIEHLACVKEGKRLVCETENSSQSDRELLNSSTSQATVVPQLLNDAQQEEIAQMLLGLIYFVLPVGVGLSIFMHDKYAQQRSATLNKQIEILEHVWNQTPQH